MKNKRLKFRKSLLLAALLMPAAIFSQNPEYEDINNIVVMEAENLNSPSSWKKANSSSGHTGSGHIVWENAQFLSTPGNGKFDVKIKINDPGKYLFQWRSQVGKGTNGADHNDTWLRFPDASDFYGEKGGSRVYPKGTGKTPNPEGASANGWFKVYRSGNAAWSWAANTFDNNAHQIYVEFDSPGIYTMEVSARSSFHIIDRIVLSKNHPNPTNLSLSETVYHGSNSTANLDGELKRSHKVTLNFAGPNTSETATPNPFSDYRLDVTFTNSTTGNSYVVPGFYSGCENPADNSCESGNVWKVHFTPGDLGNWNWSASFKTGNDVAINGGGNSAGFMDGTSGNFNIQESDKTGRDHRAANKGKLAYVGEHYLQYSGTNPSAPNGDWFVKAGADSPENMFAYDDIDNTPSNLITGNALFRNARKSWAPHQQDYVASDASEYTWAGDNGTELLGAVNYLSTKGVNAFSFLTFSLGGDDRNVFPHLLKVSISAYDNLGGKTQWDRGVHKDRFDVSKLAQWERIMEYADKKGMFMHFKTMETENDNFMDGDGFGRERKLYYRELIARFGHHHALNWNLTEESSLTNEVAIATTNYIKAIDPYDNLIVIHTYPSAQDQIYNPLLGNQSSLTGASVQTDRNKVHADVKRWVDNSANAGKKWVVANDEQGHYTIGVDVDGREDKIVRNQVLWGALMAGGAGVEYYYGYETGNRREGDIVNENHRTRDLKYTHASHALTFFNSYLQDYLSEMVSMDELTSQGGDYAYGKAGEVYTVYRPNGASTAINLPTGDWEVQWYNPRDGGALTATAAITSTLTAPSNDDWVALITSAGTTPPPSNCQNYNLDALDDFNNAQVSGFSPSYRDPARDARAIDAGLYKNVYSASTITFTGNDGNYDLILNTLTELDGESNYRVAINGTLLAGTFINPRIFGTGQPDYTPAQNTWADVDLATGDVIRIEFNSASNNLIPEGSGFAFSRGRWTSLALNCNSNEVDECAGAPSNPQPNWKDSYQAAGFCWCESTFDHDLDDITKVSFEINGTPRNIRTICDELKKHPNYRAFQNGDPVFNDIQCGNGPANTAIDETCCPGRTDMGTAGCDIKGPGWDIDWLKNRVIFGGTPPPPPPSGCQDYTLGALDDFSDVQVSGFSPSYRDASRDARAINSNDFKFVYAASTITFSGNDGNYDFVLNTLTELDGESNYRIAINGTQLAGTFTNPRTNGTGQPEFSPAQNTWANVDLVNGDVIRVEFSSESNRLVPRGTGFDFSRGRWTSLELKCNTETPEPITTEFQMVAFEDSYVRGSQYQNDNYGNGISLTLKNNLPSEEYTREVFLKFDLSQIQGTVKSAKLMMTVQSSIPTFNTASVSVYSVTDDSWTESGINWNNKPNGSALLDTKNGVPAFGNMEWDVTSFITNENNGNNLASLKVISNTPEGNNWAGFASSENSNADIRPTLIIEVEGGAPTPVTEIFNGALISIQPESTMKYLSSENAEQGINPNFDCKPVVANKDVFGGTEEFEVEILPNGTVYFKATINNLYLCSEQLFNARDGRSMTATRHAKGSWEKFTVEHLGGETYALKANNGKYVTLSPSEQAIPSNIPCNDVAKYGDFDVQLFASGSSIGTAQRFILNVKNPTAQSNALMRESDNSESTLGINQIDELKNNLVVYPNPANAAINFSLSSIYSNKDVTIVITDLMGREVYQQRYTNNDGIINGSISLSDFSDGIYIINAKTNNEQIAIKRFVKTTN